MNIDETEIGSGTDPADDARALSDDLSKRARELRERARRLQQSSKNRIARTKDGSGAEPGRYGGPDVGARPVEVDGAGPAEVDGAHGAGVGGDGAAGPTEVDGAQGAERADRTEGWSHRADAAGNWTDGLTDRFRELYERSRKLDKRMDGPEVAASGGFTDDEGWMALALDAGERVRGRTSPNPWVGAVVVTADGTDWFAGATAPAGGDHAEIAALAAAGNRAAGGTLYVTLEPCAHHGRTPPCTDAIVAAGVRRVVVGMEDPDPLVSGAGIKALIGAGLDVVVGVGADSVTDQLAPYTHHRLTGRPWVVLKLAATLDGRTAAPDGTSQWLTGEAARADAHRLRSRSDAVLVGAGTVRLDDPSLTVRLPDGDPAARPGDQQPLRVVLGHAPSTAKAQPALEVEGDLGDVLDDLGRRGVLVLLVEGGATVAHAFHTAGLVDRYVIYLAPALFGGDDAQPLFAGPGAPTLSALWRGSVRSVTSLGGDLRVELSARQRPGPDGPDRLSGPTGHEADTAGSVEHEVDTAGSVDQRVDDRSGQRE